MSPPVIGTLLLLCLGYILPAGDGCPPLAWESDQNHVMPAGLSLHIPTGGSVEASDAHIRLDNVANGLVGVFIQGQSSECHSVKRFEKYRDSMLLEKETCSPERMCCANCHSAFSNGNVVYEWKGKGSDSPFDLLHDRCVLSAVENDLCEVEDALSTALGQVRRLLMRTDTNADKLLVSLFGVEDDLSKLQEILNVPVSPVPLSEVRPRKFRRMSATLHGIDSMDDMDLAH